MSRPISATLLRSTGPGKAREPVWIRHFTWLDSAIPRATALALWDGQVGDVVSIVNKATGYELAVLRITGARKVAIEWSALVEASPAYQLLIRGF